MGVVLADHFIQTLITLLEEREVVVGRGQVVGAEVDADNIRLVTAEVPLLLQEGRLLAKRRLPGIARIFILHGHIGFGIAGLRTVVVTVGPNATARHHPVLGTEITGGDGGIGIIVVLGLVFEMLKLVHSLIAIATSDGLADEFDFSGGESRCFHQ